MSHDLVILLVGYDSGAADRRTAEGILANRSCYTDKTNRYLTHQYVTAMISSLGERCENEAGSNS